MSENTKFVFQKDINLSLKSINNFQQEKAFKIKKEGKNIDLICLTEKKDNSDFFSCKIFFDNPIIGYDDLKKEIFNSEGSLTLLKLGETFSFHQKSIVKINFTFNIPQIINLTIKNFHSGFLSDYDNKFHRLIIPIEKDIDFEIFTTKTLKIENETYFSGLVETIIDDYKYHIFKYKNENNKKIFFIIEGQEKQSFINFKKSCHSITTSIGFLTGILLQNQNFFQSSELIEFCKIENTYYEKKDNNIFNKNYITNPSHFIDYLENIKQVEKYKEFSNPLSLDFFSNLCSKIKNNNVFSRSCQLIIESYSVKQKLTEAGILSIALETITNLVYEENKERMNPISDKKLSQKIRAELKETLLNYNNVVTPEGMQILISKINELNRPTNSKKLSYPFDYYKIKLNEKELEILNHRNKFLHGTSPFNEEELESKEQELLIIIAHLRFMVNSLLLKYVGYKGHIIHYPSVIEYNLKLSISNHLFRII